MSGELDRNPNLPEIIENLRRKVYELEHRISGDSQGLDLGDLNDVRVDALGDNTISLSDGDGLVYRSSDNLWIPGAGGGGSFPISYDDGTRTYTILVDTDSLVLQTVNNADPSIQSIVQLLEGQVAIYGGTETGIYFNPTDDFQVDAVDGASIFMNAEGFIDIGSDTYVDINSDGDMYIDSGDDTFIDANGTIFISATDQIELFGINRFKNAIEIASGDLSASTFCLWLDPTPGATKLMIKAKDSGGTVRTASIPLV